MLSFNRGTPIAIIKNGKDHNKIIHLFDPNKKCCDLCNESCKSGYKKCCSECRGGACGKEWLGQGVRGDPDIRSEPSEMLDIDYIKRAAGVNKNDVVKILKLLKINAEKDNLSDIYEESNNRSKREYKIYDDGILQPLPNFNKSERHYIAGPTDSGKSYYVKNFLNEMRKVYPNKPIHIFSDVDQDKEIDSLKNVRKYKLDLDMTRKEGVIKPERFSDSIVVFDDIDSIQNSKISKMVSAFRDSLLRRGRHEDISVICTNHLMTNYKDTRIILNEVNSITFYPQSGGTDAIKYTLKKYVGLSPRQIDIIFTLPSRWVTVYKRYPMYALYEKGAYIL